jgi:hypothetical protein
MPYTHVQFIAYCIYTGPNFQEQNRILKQSYQGLSDEQNDIQARTDLLEVAIRKARDSIRAQDSSSILKTFMIPEFFFRGCKGAYENEQTLKNLMSSLSEMTKDRSWQDWIFVFGSILYQVALLPVLSGPNTKKNVVNFSVIQKGGTDASEGRIIPKKVKTDGDFIKKKDSPKAGDLLLAEDVIMNWQRF